MKDKFEEKLFPSNLAMSPGFVIGRFDAATRKYGQDRVLTNSKFKKAREIRTTAAFLLGLSKITGKAYWVMPEHILDTPDTYGISFAAHPKSEDGNIREVISIEVAEYETHNAGDLLSFVRRKLSNKYLAEHFILLVEVNRASGQINTEHVFTELSKEKLRLGEVWLLGKVEDGAESKLAVICLYSTRAGVFYQLNEEIQRNKEQTEMITMSRGKGKVASQGTLEIKLPEL